MVIRNGFSMIELIFAIVIIAIVAAGVPQMLKRNDSTLEANLVQEELFIASKVASQLLTQPWDANTEDTSTSLSYAKVLDTNSTNINFNRESISGNTLPFRIGHIKQDTHRRFHNAFSPLGTTKPANYLIPTTATPSLPANTSLNIASGYSGETNATAFAITPVQNNTAPTNMKMANITVTDTIDTSRTVTLRIYMANIGEVTFEPRRF